ncbi:hypothetical protein PIB30_030269 [Stylosanthes scabra]|uniref:Uncharacterized protein n=1 Tax=Stylosanthes scabra TaxID=79078 RepID=A0ABU6YDG6_9FABA|nr:hypothetical protein [Stylosanthes scabra]
MELGRSDKTTLKQSLLERGKGYPDPEFGEHNLVHPQPVGDARKFQIQATYPLSMARKLDSVERFFLATTTNHLGALQLHQIILRNELEELGFSDLPSSGATVPDIGLAEPKSTTDLSHIGPKPTNGPNPLRIPKAPKSINHRILMR